MDFTILANEAAENIGEHLTEAMTGRSVPFFPLMILYIAGYILFLLFQIKTAKKRSTNLGYIGCAIYGFISMIIAIILFSDINNTDNSYIKILLLLIILNIPTVILFGTTKATNQKHEYNLQSKINEMDKMNINDLD